VIDGDHGAGQPPMRHIPGAVLLTGVRRAKAISEHLVWLQNCGKDRFERDYDAPIGQMALKAAQSQARARRGTRGYYLNSKQAP
jgi:hypothetical protein